MVTKQRNLCWLLVLLTVSENIFAAQAQDSFHPKASVTRFDTYRMGYGGGVLTIYGHDFAADGFSQFDPTLGNKVTNISTLTKERS
jgi:hypothetical protein